MPAQFPRGLLQLLNEAASCQLGTVMPDGSPQITQVWVGTDGEHILVSTAECRQKLRNIRRDPRVALNVVDPPTPGGSRRSGAGWSRSPRTAPTA